MKNVIMGAALLALTVAPVQASAYGDESDCRAIALHVFETFDAIANGVPVEAQLLLVGNFISSIPLEDYTFLGVSIAGAYETELSPEKYSALIQERCLAIKAARESKRSAELDWLK